MKNLRERIERLEEALGGPQEELIRLEDSDGTVFEFTQAEIRKILDEIDDFDTGVEPSIPLRSSSV